MRIKPVDVDVVKADLMVAAKLDPKNLSMAHRLDQDDDDSYKPVKKDFNFCCWYLID